MRARLALPLALTALGIALGWAGPEHVVRGLQQRLLVARSRAVADRGYARCKALAAVEKIACYDGVLLTLAREGRVRLAMASLQRVAALDPDAAFLAHGYAHAIGMAAVDADRDPSQAFEDCTAMFDAGCSHGVIQIAFERASRVGAPEINALCGRYSGRPGGSPWLRYQCAHGVGHGLTRHLDYNLPSALERCDLFETAEERRACWSGALMENSASLREANGSPMQHAIHSDGRSPAHRHRGSLTNSSFRRIDPSDPSYPCSVLPAKYLEECYHSQPAVTLALNGLDFAATARMCDGVSTAMRVACYHGFGNQVRVQTAGNHEAAIRLCGLGAPSYQPWCYDAVVKSLVNFTTEPAEGFAFCGQVSAGLNRTQCYAALGWEISFLGLSAPKREALCNSAPPQEVAACRFGAGLSAAHPTGLPGVEDSKTQGMAR